ncbi:acyl-homoserine-lactone synthase [Poseidonocella sp. HB161398]|uniref:acyl-homoserine-lactone synthase n=1 Tax=Poseidonocella sp. HB161398 TaxID=2320855 RepID=UPI001108B5C5|nr:acyl-homoserine-lactone synthase [Poseidonocella sp. HB161398]
MLHFLYANQLHTQPALRDSMFRDRADQFSARLGWAVSVSEAGEERDGYDALDPLYVIWETGGRHGGSMRFLPSTGPTMLNDHFLGLLDGRPLRNPRIWECTRFCLARGAAPSVSAALMLGGAELGLGMGLDFSAGVFDARMTRIYARLGWNPAVLGSAGEGRDRIAAGLWHFSESIADRLAEKAGIARARSRSWYHLSMDRAARLGRPQLVPA